MVKKHCWITLNLNTIQQNLDMLQAQLAEASDSVIGIEQCEETQAETAMAAVRSCSKHRQ